MKLYHGSNIAIETIDLSKGRLGKDFGNGFYLSSELEQAQRMAQITAVRRGGEPCITTFEFDETCLLQSQLKVKIFEGYTIEWAQFILKNRLNNTPTLAHDYDIVIGPIADDKVGVQIRQLLREYITRCIGIVALTDGGLQGIRTDPRQASGIGICRRGQNACRLGKLNTRFLTESERGHKRRQLGNAELSSDIKEEIVARIAQCINDIDRTMRQSRSCEQPASRLIIIVVGVNTLGIDFRIGFNDPVFHCRRRNADLKDGTGRIRPHQCAVIKRQQRIG